VSRCGLWILLTKQRKTEVYEDQSATKTGLIFDPNGNRKKKKIIGPTIRQCPLEIFLRRAANIRVAKFGTFERGNDWRRINYDNDERGSIENDQVKDGLCYDQFLRPNVGCIWWERYDRGIVPCEFGEQMRGAEFDFFFPDYHGRQKTRVRNLRSTRNVGRWEP